jgi:integrase
MRIAGKRAFHNRRSGKLGTGSARNPPAYCGPYKTTIATSLQSEGDGANWRMASIARAATAIAAILVREGVDYAQSKAVFRAARQRAGLHAPPERRGVVDRLTVEEELRFLDQAYAQGGRTGLMLQTLLETGARASELVQIRIEDVSLTERVVAIRQGKGGKHREVPIRRDLAQLLRLMLSWTSCLPTFPDATHTRGAAATNRVIASSTGSGCSKCGTWPQSGRISVSTDTARPRR